MSFSRSWNNFKRDFYYDRGLGFSLDYSCVGLKDGDVERLQPLVERAFAEMRDLEAGAVANLDEKRMVGHYWLRAPELAPNAELTSEIEAVKSNAVDFAQQVSAGKLVNEKGAPFETALIIGIGGSALGPQLVYSALGKTGLELRFIDNTDPDGIVATLSEIADLSKTLVVVISKSGGTQETKNGMLIVRRVLEERGMPFPIRAVAITGQGSELDQLAEKERWLRRFPMWDWVGGRTSELSAVGLLPAALHGADVDALLRGARQMDVLTRQPEVRANPAALLALSWYVSGDGKGRRDMVVLPYRDRLLLFSRYLQQLVMESLGKAYSRDGQPVHQGLAVYGNKGSTDQHAFVQQLRDGLDNFFVVFIVAYSSAFEETSALKKYVGFAVQDETTAGDYLHGFFLGTREALVAKGRRTLSIHLERFDAQALGALIALFERAVGFYASMVDINAYHQPGVEAGKTAAKAVVELQGKIWRLFTEQPDREMTVSEVAAHLAAADRIEDVFYLLRYMAHSGRLRETSAEQLELWSYRKRPGK